MKQAKENPDRQYRERVYRIVRRIPPGRVMTYGQIAYMLGEGYTPRTVGFVMHGADEGNTPWHRVINSQGRTSTARLRSEEHTSELQSLAYLVCRLLLEKKKIYN